MIMDIISLFKYFAFILAAYYTLKHIILRNKLRSLPPSPFLSFPIIGHLYLFKKPLHRSLARVAEQYGPILYMRFGSRPVVLISSPSAVEESLVQNDVFGDRPRDLLSGKYNGNNYTSIAWAPVGAHWKNLRRIAAVEILSPQRLQILSDIRANVARSFIRRTMKLQSSSESNGVIEMKSAIFGLTLDNMMRMLVGKSNFEEGNNGAEYCRRFEEIVEESLGRSGVSNLEDFLPLLKWFKVFLGSNEDILKKMTEEKDEIMKAYLKEHREMEKEGKLSDERKRSMLHVLLSMQKEDPEYYNDEMIASLNLSLFQAGTDTSAATIVWAFSLLLNNPEILKKAQDEIDKNVGHERLVEESDKINIPYIQCIVNETLRMYPTGPLALPRESVADCNIQGYHVPRGSMLVYNIWAIHNDPKIWEEPRKFKPERFTGVQGTRLGYKFMPFGTGRRSCPGENLAGRVIWLAMASMIQCFDWERVGSELVDMKEIGGVSLTKLEPLKVKCHPRPKMMKLLSQL